LAAILILAIWPEFGRQSWMLVAVAWPIVWVDWTLFSVRRKLAIALWPRPLYL
jgi:hypothetical protein